MPALTCVMMTYVLSAVAANEISLTTRNTQIVLRVADDGRVYQVYFGKRLPSNFDLALLSQPNVSQTSTSHYGWEVYPVMGSGGYYEPAVEIRHEDGNPTSVLKYVSHSQEATEERTKTVIRLRDEVYPVDVTLYYVSYTEEDIIRQWSEICHSEDGEVYLSRYASSILYFESPQYYLTEFVNDWGREMRAEESRLTFGKKILDSRLGTRATMLTAPFFELGVGGEVKEDSGEVLMGTLCWTGNFRFTFEVDHNNALRVVSGINPDASIYFLKKGETFVTPETVFTLSFEGVGRGSRNFRKWATKYWIYGGDGDRKTILNNWESTGCDFDEALLADLIGEAKDLGVDIFLLDDGWFGNKYPRNDDHTSLGDWDVNRQKLPHGISYLTEQTDSVGIGFGLWIEPEMVSPKSVLAETHPEWIMRFPGRDTYYFRNQLVLDLASPEVQDFCFNVVDSIMKATPDIKFLKWDCNSPIVNAYSPYEGRYQGRMYIDYVRGLYSVVRRIRNTYPCIDMMLCAGGGGRTDYEALKYFTEFWPSDNTSSCDRLRIQWGYSQFMPSKTICAHVTSWEASTDIKFRVDVAFPFKLGFDINLRNLQPQELDYCRQALKEFNRLKPVIFEGNLYRLVSPYNGEHCVLQYATDDKTHALIFAYDMHPDYAEDIYPTRFEGLDPDADYALDEICLKQGQQPLPECDGRIYSGAYLMDVGIRILSSNATTSHIVELIKK